MDELPDDLSATGNLPALDSNKTALLEALDAIAERERDGFTLTKIVILAEMEDETRYRRMHLFRGFGDVFEFAGYLMALGAKRLAMGGGDG